MVKFFHNPRCRKSRAGLDYLKLKGSDPEVVDYIKNPLSEKDLAKLLSKLGIKPHDIVKTQDELYKKEIKRKNLSDTEWIKALALNPRLIRRPIVDTETKAVIGDPANQIAMIL